MNLSDYFDNTKGYGVLATADSSGKVNAAVYARSPSVWDMKLSIVSDRSFYKTASVGQLVSVES